MTGTLTARRVTATSPTPTGGANTFTLHNDAGGQVGGITLKDGGWFAWRDGGGTTKTCTRIGRPLAAIAARELFDSDGANAVLRMLAMVAA